MILLRKIYIRKNTINDFTSERRCFTEGETLDLRQKAQVSDDFAFGNIRSYACFAGVRNAGGKTRPAFRYRKKGIEIGNSSSAFFLKKTPIKTQPSGSDIFPQEIFANSALRYSKHR